MEGVRGSAAVPRYPAKDLRIRYNLFAETETLSLSVYEPIAMQILLGGTVPPICGEGVEFGGRIWYTVKAHRTGQNVFIETDTLSLFVYEPITIQI